MDILWVPIFFASSSNYNQIAFPDCHSNSNSNSKYHLGKAIGMLTWRSQSDFFHSVFHSSESVFQIQIDSSNQILTILLQRVSLGSILRFKSLLIRPILSAFILDAIYHADGQRLSYSVLVALYLALFLLHFFLFIFCLSLFVHTFSPSCPLLSSAPIRHRVI